MILAFLEEYKMCSTEMIKQQKVYLKNYIAHIKNKYAPDMSVSLFPGRIPLLTMTVLHGSSSQKQTAVPSQPLGRHEPRIPGLIAMAYMVVRGILTFISSWLTTREPTLINADFCAKRLYQQRPEGLLHY
jgi:hypothetical protein